MAFLHARRGAQMTHPSELKPYALLANYLTPPTTYAHTLAQCEDLTGLVALGLMGQVIIGHHFLFDMHMPFKPDSSKQVHPSYW